MNLLVEALMGSARAVPGCEMDRAGCRRKMRLWAFRWRSHRRFKEQFDLAEMCLGNALGWRDRASWAQEMVE